MGELIPILTSIALVDSTSITPVALVPLMQVLAGARPYRVAAAFLVGLYVSYLAMALAFLFGLNALFLRFNAWLSHRWHHPEPVDFLVELVVGLLLVYFALRRRDVRRERTAGKTVSAEVSPAAAFGFASMLNLVGFPGALPYFAAADAILRADLPSSVAVLSVVYYVLVFVVPLTAIVVLRAVLGRRGDGFMQAVSRFFETWGKRVLMVLMLVLGAVMTVDAVAFWLRGVPLIPVGWPGGLG